MANICSFSMLVKGRRNNIENFYNAMSQNGTIYMGRGAEAEIDYEWDDNCAKIDGWCKWSIQSALINNAISMREEPEIWSFGTQNGSKKANELNLEFITLWEACEKWNLTMEVYSEEPGCCFQEHYICENGDVVCDECVDYYEYWLELYDTKTEAESDIGFTITDEQWENKDVICDGGFENWDFTI